MEKNSILMGIVLGAIVPVIGFFCLEQLFDFLSLKGVIAEAVGEGLMKRLKTVGLIAICFNLIPFEICRSKRYDETLRGIVFPTLIYVGFWVYKYSYVLFS
jgi:hypothetical protein